MPRSASAHLGIKLLFIVAAIGCDRRSGLSENSPLVDLGSGRFIAAVVVDGRASLYQLSESEAAQALTSGDDEHPAASANGRTVAFSRLQDGGRRALWLLDRDSGSTRRLTTAQAGELWPVFLSEDVIAFARARSVRDSSTLGTRFVDWDAYTLNLKTGVETPATSQHFEMIDRIAACPTANALGIVATEKGQPPGLLTVRRDGVFAWNRSVTELHDAAFASDCRKAFALVFGGARPNGVYNYDLVVAELGLPLRTLVRLGTRIEWPSLSRDESTVYFIVDDDEQPRSVWRVSALGGDAVQLRLRLP